MTKYAVIYDYPLKSRLNGDPTFVRKHPCLDFAEAFPAIVIGAGRRGGYNGLLDKGFDFTQSVALLNNGGGDNDRFCKAFKASSKLKFLISFDEAGDRAYVDTVFIKNNTKAILSFRVAFDNTGRRWLTLERETELPHQTIKVPKIGALIFAD